MELQTPYIPKNKVRIVTAASLFDGHDAAINIMRRIIQATGVEVIHLGHDRSVEEVVNTAIQEDANAIAMTSYQGGHNEYFKYMFDLLKEKGAEHIKIFGGGGGVILPSEIAELQEYGITRIYSPDDGRALGLQGMINDLVKQADFPVGDKLNGEINHLEEKIIITPLNPEETFSDDPLRMMRAIRFATQLDFKISTDALEAIKKNKKRIAIVSKERITDELNKIILAPVPSIGFKYLFDTGLLKEIFPQMCDLHGVDIIDGKGHKDNFYHTLEVLDNICHATDDLWVRWAAILHDIAKPATKRFEKKHGWTFHGHEDKGARMVPKIFAQLKLPLNEKMKLVQKLVLLHLRPIVLAQDVVTDSAVRRLLFEAGEDIEALMQLCHADVTTKNEYKKKKYRSNFELVQQKLKDVEERDQIRNWQPPITGQDIMEAFNISAGKEVGIIKNQIREAILEGEIKNDRQEAIKLMIKLGEQQNLSLVNSIN